MGLETTQPSLLSRVRDPNDQVAWKQFDEKYRELILRYCRRCGLQMSDAEDVRQVVMLNLSRFLPQFRYAPEQGRFRSYLGTVVRNAISQLRRPNGRDRPLDTVVLANMQAVSESDNTNEAWEHEWVNHHYRQAMQVVRKSFDPRSVAAFDRLLAGDDVAQVADSFGMSTQAVHKIKQRVRRRLKELITSQIREEDEATEP